MLHHEKSERRSSSSTVTVTAMKKMLMMVAVTLVMITWIPEVHCVMESLNVLDDVLRFTQNGSPVRVPVQQVALGSGGTILWAAAQNGILYQINATTMVYINSTTLSSTATVATGLFVDDTFNRVYACYVISTTAINFIVNSITGVVITSCPITPFTLGSTAYDLSLTKNFYDPASRRLGSVFWVPSTTSGEMGYHDIVVTSDTCTPNRDESLDFLYTALSGVQYINSSDTLVLWFYYSTSGGIWKQDINFFESWSTQASGGDPDFSPSTISNAPPYTGTGGIFSGLVSAGNYEYLSGPMTFTSAYSYAVYISNLVPSSGSAVVQYVNPISYPGGTYTPQSLTTFPTELTMLAISLDETAINSTSGVIFMSTTDGQVKKYRYGQTGSGPMSVATPNYNNGTFIDSPPPCISSQIYSKTTQSIYLVSSTTAGGVWRVPFHSCHVATSCTTCIALNDPYCGWCPLANLCGILSTCSTGTQPFFPFFFFLFTFLFFSPSLLYSPMIINHLHLTSSPPTQKNANKLMYMLLESIPFFILL